jgi:uncharacterized membrane protein
MIHVSLFINDIENDENKKIINIIRSLRDETPHTLAIVDVKDDADLEKIYGDDVPMLKAGPYSLKAPFDRENISVMIKSADQRVQELPDEHIVKKRAQIATHLESSDKISYWFSRNYMWVILGVLFLYITLPFVAPIALKYDKSGIAKPIYSAYRLVCHELAFRSWFLFGDQPAYPREAAHFKEDEWLTYEEVTGSTSANSAGEIWDASRFTGEELNGEIGYKVALCQRCLAIYGTLFLFGLIFVVTGRKIPQLPWYVWLLVGLVPIGLDGFSQLISQMLNLPWFDYRESTPVLRTLTGSLFGLTTGWFGFPAIQETADEVKAMVKAKVARMKNYYDEIEA